MAAGTPGKTPCLSWRSTAPVGTGTPRMRRVRLARSHASRGGVPPLPAWGPDGGGYAAIGLPRAAGLEYHELMERVDCIIPAAGSASRMGRAKLLLPFRGGTIIEASVSAALSACQRVILVVGCGAAALAAHFKGEPRVLPVENPDWRSGMFSSIFRGMREVGTDRFFIALGDMPMIGPEVYIALLQAPPAEAAAPVFRGTRGHPVLLGQRVRQEALRQDPASASMREILAGYAVSEVPWENDTILSDVDTPEDYERRTSS